MTQYPIPPKTDAKPDPEVLERKEKRKKLLEEIRKKRAKVLGRLYTR